MAEKRWKSRKTVKFSGGGPHFQSGFEQWCKNRMSKHELSSSYNPQSNGDAEQAVNTVKGILKKTDTKQWSPTKPNPELVRTVRAAKLDKSGQVDNSTLDLALQEIMDIADKVLHADRGRKVRQNKKIPIRC